MQCGKEFTLRFSTFSLLLAVLASFVVLSLPMSLPVVVRELFIGSSSWDANGKPTLIN